MVVPSFCVDLSISYQKRVERNSRKLSRMYKRKRAGVKPPNKEANVYKQKEKRENRPEREDLIG